MDNTMHENMLDFGIVNYNGSDSLLSCVKSILAMEGVQVRVFVCDNGSRDGSVAALRASALPCQIEETGMNLGYAGACNRLLSRMDAPVQVLCNMDLQFAPDWGKVVLDAFVRFPEAGSIASLVQEENGSINALGVLFHTDMHAVNEASGLQVDDLGALQEKEVFGCYGAVMAFRRSVAEQAGPLDESFFLFYEETEWYLRHNLLGFVTQLVPSARVFHERSKTTVRYSPLKLYYSERNRVRSALRYLPWRELLGLPFASLNRYLAMAREGVPDRDASGQRNPKWKLGWNLVKAWLAAVAYWPCDRKKAKNLERLAGSDYRRKALAILRRYPV